MTLLAPTAALIALGITLPALIAFYMLKLRRRTVRVSSTMFWESRTSDLQVNVPLRWLRVSALFLLHLAILLLLVGALGRPAIEGDAASGGVVYLVVDRSASMGARDGEGGRTRLEEARRRAETIGRRALGSGAQGVGVIAFAREARIVVAPTRSANELARAIGSIGPSEQAGDLAGALALVEALGAGDGDEAGESSPALAVVLSDGLSARDGPLALAGARARYERVGPAAGSPRDNAGIVALGAARDPDDPALVRVFVRAQSVSPEPVATTIDVRVDGEEAGRTPIVLDAAETGSPSSAARTLELRLPEGGVVGLSLAREDGLAADNGAWLVARAPRRPSVLVVAPDAQADPFLMDVLAELDLRSLRVVGPGDYERFAGGDLGGIDLLVFDRASVSEAPTRASLSFGVGMPGYRAGEEAGPTRVVSWSRAHPVLRDVTLDSVYVARWRPLAPAGEGVVEPIATGDAGALIVAGESGSVRRVGVGFELAQSNWSVQVGFAIFVAGAVDWLTASGRGGEEWFVTTGEAARVPAGGERTRVLGPVERVVPSVAAGAGGLADVGVLDRAGVYRVEGVDGFALAVNLLDARESTIGTRDELLIAGRSVESGGGGTRERREIWWWFVLLAGALLIAEWTLAAWRMRV